MKKLSKKAYWKFRLLINKLRKNKEKEQKQDRENLFKVEKIFYPKKKKFQSKKIKFLLLLKKREEKDTPENPKEKLIFQVIVID